MSGSFHRWTLGETRAALERGEVTPSELLQASLLQARTFAADNAFITLDDAGATSSAEEATERRAEGKLRSPYDGIPIALKDNIVTEGLRTTAGSRFLDGWIPPYASTVAERLRAAGFVIVGKTNLDEFGMGSSGEHSAFGPTLNPREPGRVPGGSSSGSAAAVARGTVSSAFGTDTGGSVRLPAAYCRIMGLRPSYGRVSRWGVVAHASSLDQVGPLARSVDDLEVLLSLVAGVDARDATSVPADLPRDVTSDVGPMTIGRLSLGTDVEATVGDATETAAVTLRKAGYRVVDLDPGLRELALDTYYVLSSAEAASNLARYDGIRFGQPGRGSSFEETVVDARTRGFGPEVKRRIFVGNHALSAADDRDLYERAARARTLIQQAHASAFAQVDVLLGPVSATDPFPLGSRTADPVHMYRTDAYTVPIALIGGCGLALPIGASAVQLTAPPFAEARLFRLARQLEVDLELGEICRPGDG